LFGFLLFYCSGNKLFFVDYRNRSFILWAVKLINTNIPLAKMPRAFLITNRRYRKDHIISATVMVSMRSSSTDLRNSSAVAAVSDSVTSTDRPRTLSTAMSVLVDHDTTAETAVLSSPDNDQGYEDSAIGDSSCSSQLCSPCEEGMTSNQTV